jgi:hypothetical protein
MQVVLFCVSYKQASKKSGPGEEQVFMYSERRIP